MGGVLSFFEQHLEVIISLAHLAVLVVGVCIARRSISNFREMERKKQTANLLFHTRTDSELVGGLRCLSEIHNGDNTNIRSFAKEENKDKDEAKSIRYVLNHWEYVSVGIQNGIYDEGMLRRASYNTVISLYKHAKPFVEAIREETKRNTLYQELEWLANQWDKAGPAEKKE